MKQACLWLLGICGALGPFGGRDAWAQVAEAERPNILWLVSEDQSYPHAGFAGDPLARTPNLDRLAREGVVFERCFTQPVCAPSRFGIITGMYAIACGPAEHMRAQGRIPEWLVGFPTLLRNAGYYTSNHAKTDYNAPVDPKRAWDDSRRGAHYRNRPPGKRPFFSVFNHEVCHESCLFPEQDPKMDFEPTDPGKVRLPAYLPDTPEIRKDWARRNDCITLMDQQVGVKLRELEEAGEAANTIVFFYGDNGGILPRSKRFLQQSGTHVPLVVYFPPKWRHLAPAAPGSRVADPVCTIDFAPTVLALAGLPKPVYMQGRAFAGEAPEPAREFVFCTRDRMDERYDMMRSVMDRRWLYIRNFRPDLPYVQPLAYMFKARGYQSWARLAREGKLTGATSMFWGAKPTEELYDMANDPDNVRNLAGDPAQRACLERMRAALRRHTVEVVDNGLIPEGSVLEGYEASRQPGAFPVERVFDLACLASDRDVANVDRLAAALRDESEPVRWWAAQGLGMLGQRAMSKKAALEGLLSDPSGAVQIAAAEALIAMGGGREAMPVLERWLQQSENFFFKLQAANVASRIGESARPLLAVLKGMLGSGEAPRAVGRTEQYGLDIVEKTVAVLEGSGVGLVYPAAGR
jgi:arylsulfatase A-like enzyme